MFPTYDAILWTGQRHWTDHHTIEHVLNLTKPTVLIEGAAKGADTIAHRWAVSKGFQTVTLCWRDFDHPPLPSKNISIRFPVTNDEWDEIGKRAGMLRNAAMLAYLNEEFRKNGVRCAVIGSVDEERFGISKGTVGCLKEARKRGFEVWNIVEDIDQILSVEEAKKWKAWRLKQL